MGGLLCEAGVNHQQKASRNDKKITPCRLMLLNSMTLMRLVILSRKRKNNLMELEADPMAEEIGDVSSVDCMLKIQE